MIRTLGVTEPTEAKDEARFIERAAASALEADADLPPVVARMVVEIRSDGTRTVARGALEDLTTGHKVALRTSASTPLELVRKLSGSLLELPLLGGGKTIYRLTTSALSKLRGR